MKPNSKIAPIQNLILRAQANAEVRHFFEEAGYLEIETASMRPTTATDLYIQSFDTQTVENETRYFQTSPEFAHKIFLATYRRPIFEMARVYRKELHGHLHRSEFSLVEWYKPEADYRDMMTETEALIRRVSACLGAKTWHSDARKVGCTIPITDEPFERLTVNEAFKRHAGFEPIGMTREELIDATRKAGCRVEDNYSWDDAFFYGLMELVEPHLGMDHPTYLCDYPAQMASLAMVRGEGPTAVAERFELYICGIELCNGYSELNDPDELRHRFELDNEARRQKGIEQLPIDEDLLEALPHLGKLGGNAMGFERLLMICLGESDMSQVRIDV